MSIPSILIGQNMRDENLERNLHNNLGCQYIIRQNINAKDYKGKMNRCNYHNENNQKSYKKKENYKNIWSIYNGKRINIFNIRRAFTNH